MKLSSRYYYYCKTLNVGKIDYIHHNDENECLCIGVKTNLSDSLQHIVNNSELFQMFKFLSSDQQKKIEGFLKSR